MPKEITLKFRVPTKEELNEIVEKTIKHLEGVVNDLVKVEVVETPTEEKPKE